MTRDYKLIPTLPPIGETETLAAYGLRVLQFVVREECTATLTDADLEQADHFYPLAIAAPELSPATIDRLADARRMLQASLRWRQDDARNAADITATPAPAGREKPNLGPMAPLRTPPDTRPPTPTRIVPNRDLANVF